MGGLVSATDRVSKVMRDKVVLCSCRRLLSTYSPSSAPKDLNRFDKAPTLSLSYDSAAKHSGH